MKLAMKLEKSGPKSPMWGDKITINQQPIKEQKQHKHIYAGYFYCFTVGDIIIFSTPESFYRNDL